MGGQQRPQFVGADDRAGVLTLQHAVGQIAFAAMKIDDLFFDRSGGDQSINRDRTLLADPVRATARLVFCSRISPRVDDDHVVGCREVETEAAGLETDQEQVALARLKRRHASCPLG